MGFLYLIFRGIVNLVRYTLPVTVVIVGISLGISGGIKVKDRKVENWVEDELAATSHSVTIDWGYSGKRDTITVYENQPWTVNGYSWGHNLYAQYDYTYESFIVSIPSSNISTPTIPDRSGYVFMGLYSSEVGGIQYTNGAGYGLRKINTNMTLYALWEEAY